MGRAQIAAGNWKMHKTPAEGTSLAREIREDWEATDSNVELVIAPPFTHLQALHDVLEGSGIILGAQNCHAEPEGAFTGEISVGMLSDLGVRYVIVGHSERRQLFGEGNDMIKRKVDAVLRAGLQPIFCCGEPLAVREAREQEEYVLRQLEESIFHLTDLLFAQVVIAYEPIWAIGTGKTASPQQAQDMHAFLRTKIRARYSDSVAEETPILYGGSVKPGNAADLFDQYDVDGGLIGGASLEADGFLAIAKELV